MRFVIEQSAGPGARLAQDAFASQIGKGIPVEVAPDRYEQGVIRSAEVIENGAKVRLKIEMPDSDEILALFDPGLSRHNVGFRLPWFP